MREPLERDVPRRLDNPAFDPRTAAPGSGLPHRAGTVERQAVRGVFWLGGSSLVNRLVLMATMAVLATRLEPREFGILAVVMLASQTAIIFNDFGFADALVYQPTRAREAAETVMSAVLAGSALVAAALWFGAPTIARLFHVPDAVHILRAYCFVVLVNGAGRCALGVLTRELAFSRRSSVEAVPAILGGMVTIPLAFYGFGVWSVAIGDMARALVTLAMALVALPVPIRPRWHRDVAREMRPYAQKSLVSTGGDFALANVDYLLVGWLLGPVALGYYSLAFRIASLPLLLITNVLGGVAFPAFARLLPDRDRVRRAFQTQIHAGNAIVFLAGGGLFVLAPSLQVLGTKWAPAVATARALGVYVCLRSAAHMTVPLLQAVGAPGAIAWLRAAWVTSLALLIATVGRSGITTVGEIQAVVAIALLGAHALTARRLAGIDLATFAGSIIRPGLAVAVAGLVTAAVHASAETALPYASVHGFLLLATVFTTAYAGSLALFHPALRREARSLLVKLRTQEAPI